MQAKVVQVQVASNKYPVQNGVKQGCVLCWMLEVALTAVSKGEYMYIQMRYDANLITIPQLKTETLTIRFLVRDLLFADDNVEDMLMLVDCIFSAVSHFCLKITIKKTYVHLLSQSI